MSFEFKTQPYKHQLDCWNVSKERKNYALFLEMGCGKTKIVIDTAAYLNALRGMLGLLVVAPKSVYMNWADHEIPTHMSPSVQIQVAAWSSYQLKKDKIQLDRLMREPGHQLRILLMNVESLLSDAASDLAIDFLKKFGGMMVVDESTTIKHLSSKRTRMAITIGKYADYRRICSGNPMPNGPLDLYAQTEFLETGITGYENYYAFRNKFAIMQDMQLGPRSIKQVVGYRNEDKLRSILSNFSFIIKKTDCLDLPQKIYQTRTVQMSAEQKKAYEEMKSFCCTLLEKDTTASAEIVLTQLTRLHQIVCGFITTDDKKIFDFENNPRMSELESILDEVEGKAIIWANYERNIEQIIKMLSNKYGKDRVRHFYGKTTEEQRAKVRQEFRDPSSHPTWLVANQAAGKFGNSFVAASTVLYYSNDYDLEKREQSEDRTHRIGQLADHVLYVDFVCPDTVDQRILKVLRNKKVLSDDVVRSNWKWLLGIE